MNIRAIGKALDQPLLISKLKDKTPKILGAAALAYGVYDTFNAPKEERKKRGIKNAVILSAVVGTSLISAFGIKTPGVQGKAGRQILGGLVNVKGKDEILNTQKAAVDEFLANNNVSDDVSRVLNKAKTGLLNVKDTEIFLNMGADGLGRENIGLKGKEKLLDTLFSKKEDLSAKEIFEETGRLSVLGLAPVAAGVLSGIAAEKITGESTPKSSSNKIKEGAYQFLANIFMCNVGAAGALFGAERLQKAGVIKSLSPLQKLAVIMGGIFVTGIMGGSLVANFIGKKILDPIFDKKQHNKPRQAWNPYFSSNLNTFTSKNKAFEVFRAQRERLIAPNAGFGGAKEKNAEHLQHAGKHRHNGHNGRYSHNSRRRNKLYDERKPELLDMALHTDDIATAGVLSGFKWIEPMLPLMYTISGYRAGIGYRNSGK